VLLLPSFLLVSLKVMVNEIEVSFFFYFSRSSLVVQRGAPDDVQTSLIDENPFQSQSCHNVDENP
jgi:hypothetical protein